jgi:hypothetical protein
VVDGGGGTSPRARWGLRLFVAGWIAVLAGGAVWAIAYGTPTAREQTTIQQARPAVDRAAAELVRAAGPEAIISMSGYEEASDCKVTAVRPGKVYRRVVQVYGAPGGEAGVLGQVAKALPSAYKAVASSGKTPRLIADAGDFVRVSGSVAAPGEVQLVVDTGCRAVDGTVTTDAASDAATGRTQVDAALTALGLPSQRASYATNAVTCPDGSTLWTVEGTVGATPTAPQWSALAAIAGSTPVLNRADVYAYRAAGLGVAVTQALGHTSVTAANNCPQ